MAWRRMVAVERCSRTYVRRAVYLDGLVYFNRPAQVTSVARWPMPFAFCFLRDQTIRAGPVRRSSPAVRRTRMSTLLRWRCLLDSNSVAIEVEHEQANGRRQIAVLAF